MGICAELAQAEGAGSRLTDHRWTLASVKVANFRGATHESLLQLDPNQKLTILHGLNGAGKTTLIEAMRVAIYGTLDPSHIGQLKASSRTLGKLWLASEQRPDPSKPCHIVVVLESEESFGTTLEIEAEFGADRQVCRTATLRHPGGDPVRLTEDSPDWELWDVAARAFPPSYSYAALNEEIRNPGDIHGWLYSGLGLGLAPAAVEDALNTRQSRAKESSRIIDDSLSAAKEAVQKIDNAARERGIEVNEIEWTQLTSEVKVEDWCSRNDIGPGGEAPAALPDDAASKVKAAAAALDEAFTAWKEAVVSGIDGHCLDALLKLHAALTSPHQHIEVDACPVCGNEDSDWGRVFQDKVSRWHGSDLARRQRDRAIDQHGPKLVSLVADTLSHLSPEKRASSRVVDLKKLVPDRDLMGSVAYVQSVDFREALEGLVRLALDEETLSLVDDAVHNAGRRSSWMNMRRQALAEYLDIDVDVRRSAESLPVLSSARAIWNPILRQIREDRKDLLEKRIGHTLGDLFVEHNIALDGLVLPKSEKGFEMHLSQTVSDQGSGEEGGDGAASRKQIELAHLSAGQRNILLLAPMVAAPPGGLFVFRVFDDPVHALDEVRVDRLAHNLVAQTQSLQVVVATHDARLAEHLTIPAKGAVSNCEITLVDGQVKATPIGRPWEQLLVMAAETRGELGVASKDGAGSSPPAAKDRQRCAVEVRALLRMALDACLEFALRRRLWLVQEGVRSEVELVAPEDVSDFALRINSAKTLRERKSLLLDEAFPDGVLQGVEQSRRALARVDCHLQAWNNASHSSLSDPPNEAQWIDVDTLRGEVDSGKKVCSDIARIWG